jgi:hypothetical protein
MYVASKLSMFLAELRRRKVTRVSVVYALVGLGVIEGAGMILPVLHLEAGYPYIVIFVLFGFPLALVFAWAYEITPEGLKKEKDLDPIRSSAYVANNKVYFTIIGLLVVALTVMTLWPIADRDSPSPQDDADQPNPDGPSIAVLSFLNDSGDPDQDYFSSGLTDDIITGGSRTTSSQDYRSTRNWLCSIVHLPRRPLVAPFLSAMMVPHPMHAIYSRGPFAKRGIVFE